MPTYEFRCRTCGSTFDVSRPMDAAREPAHCPAGHDDTVKLLTTVGITGRSEASATPASGGGCCGGACGCGS
ncbi:FmdB family zinc ribbon protein [Phytoactinopolyspora endophytica]|uniref:FmdB family zinc ribbon protein n=1 Tax=Phytoactinopolyspora endophytica TaxID=1642495 RepID=UPI00101CEA4A